MFALKLALRPWRLQPLSQILTFCTLSVLLLLAGFFASLASALPEVRKSLEGDQIASVFLEPSAEPVNLKTFRDEIKISLGSSAAAVKMDYVDGDAFLSVLQEKQPELAREVAALGNEKDWVTPRHFALRGPIGEKAIERLRTIPGVETVTYSAQRFKPIVDNLSAISWLSRVLFSAILLTMVAVLILLGRLNAATFAEAEGIVSQMGGSHWQARFPAHLNPILLSSGAGFVAAMIFLKLNPWFFLKMSSLSPFFSEMKDASSVSPPLLLALGLVIGSIAFLFSPNAEKALR